MPEAEELLARVNEYYGSSYGPEGRLILRKERLFLYTGEETKIIADWMGLNIANTDLSVTIEGAQAIGVTATKNVVELTQKDAQKYYCGCDLPNHQGSGPVILKTKDRIVGHGLLEDGKIRNTLPKSRLTEAKGSVTDG